jgi:glycosyltransferase involved in cell wall biosynthesis
MSVVRSLHVGDCAFTAERLVHEARRQGLPWRQIPLATDGVDTTGALRLARMAWAGAKWAPRLLAQSRGADVLHVHYASVVRHVRFVRKPYFLHLHGSDIRTQAYEERWAPVIAEAVRGAIAVSYPTPELADHAHRLRPDAFYLPIPVTVSELPVWSPRPTPQVVVASRWDASKGLAAQLQMAGDLVRALDGKAEVVGLDWGPGAREATKVGVQLVPRMSHDAFLELLSGAHAVLGQSSGILATSELETLGMGVPLGMTADLSLYAPDPPPLLAGSPTEVVEALVARVLGQSPHDPAAGRAWLTKYHDVSHAVRRIEQAYEDGLASHRRS